MHRISTLSLSATVLIFGSVFFLAPLAAQAALFAPGATLDPGCPPTDISTCGIATSTQVTVATLSATTTLPGIITLPNLTTVSTGLTGFLKATAGVLSTALVNLASDVTGILPVSNGGTGVSAIKSGFIPFGNGTGAVATSSALYFDATNGFLGVGTSSPFTTLSVQGNGYFSGSLNVGDPATTRSNLGLSYASSDDIVNIGSESERFQDSQSIAAWGDSLTYGYGGGTTAYPTVLSTLSGHTVYNGGLGGDTSAQIKIRMLATNAKYYWPTIIWAGRNDIPSIDPSVTKSNIASMVAALESVGNNNYIILSVTNSLTETSGTSNYNAILDLNLYLATTYGSHYLDVRSFLIHDALADAGLTPTAQDLTDIANDTIPTQLHFDAVHFNATGYTEIAKYIYAHINLLQSSETVSSISLITTQGLHALLASDVVSVAGSFSANGSIGVSQYASFKQGGVTILTASTTNQNVLVGQSAGQALLSDGTYNVALGYQALYSAASSDNNVAIGRRALYLNTTGASNTALGSQALYSNTTGANNTALGYQALYANTGANNTALGYQALYANTGSSNIALGYQALISNTTGSSNLALGYQAGFFSTNTNYNSVIDNNMTFIGALSSRDASIASTTALTKATAVGYNAKVGGSNMLALGGIGADAVKVGIGTSTPFAQLSIHANAGSTNKFVFAIGSSTAAYATTTLFSIANTGDVTINGSSGSTCTIGNGTSGTSCSSDAALKNVIGPIPNALDGIKGITGILFHWKDSTKSQATYIGVLAQDVQKYFPEAVSMGANGYLSVDYAALVAPLIEAVKELAHKVDALAVSITTAVLNATTGNFTHIKTQDICVGDTCITETQLKTILQNNGQQSAAAPAAAPETPAPDATVEPVSDEVVPAEDATVETPPEAVPDAAEAPAVEPAVELAPAQ